MKGEKIYTEEQVNRLLQRAIERQEADQKHHYDNQHGLTLTEIERVATEVGIDPRYVRLALADIHRPRETPFEPGIWGSPRLIEITKEIPGRLSDTAIAEILSEIRSNEMGLNGDFDKSANRFDWSTKPGSSVHRVSIKGEPWEQNTVLSLKFDMSQAQVLIHFLPTFLPLFFGFMLTLTGKAPLALPIVIGVLGVVFFFLRWGITQMYKSKQRECEALMDRLVSIAIERHEQASNWSYEDQKSNTGKPVISLDDAETYNVDQSDVSYVRNKTRSSD